MCGMSWTGLFIGLVVLFVCVDVCWGCIHECVCVSVRGGFGGSRLDEGAGLPSEMCVCVCVCVWGVYRCVRGGGGVVCVGAGGGVCMWGCVCVCVCCVCVGVCVCGRGCG